MVKGKFCRKFLEDRAQTCYVKILKLSSKYTHFCAYMIDTDIQSSKYVSVFLYKIYLSYIKGLRSQKTN